MAKIFQEIKALKTTKIATTIENQDNVDDAEINVDK